MQKINAVRGGARRRTILLAAVRILATKGYYTTTLADIAGAAGLQTGSLYYHFASREDLIEEVLRTSTSLNTRRLEAALKELPAVASALDKIRAGLRAHVGAMLSDEPYLA